MKMHSYWTNSPKLRFVVENNINQRYVFYVWDCGENLFKIELEETYGRTNITDIFYKLYLGKTFKLTKAIKEIEKFAGKIQKLQIFQ